MPDDQLVPKSLQVRLDQYENVVELRKSGLTNRQTGEALNIGVDKVRYWLAGSKPKRVWRYEPDLVPCRDLAYLTGFYLGDGKEAGEEHQVRFGLADPEQLEHVGGLVAKLLGRKPKPISMEGGFYVVQYDSVALSDFLHHDIKWLAEYLRDFIPDFLRGFFDAEGYASCRVEPIKCKIPRIIVGVANTSLDYLDCVRQQLAQRGINPGLHKTNRAGEEMTIRGHTWIRKHDVYHLQIGRAEEIKMFRDEVGFRNPTKADKLTSIVTMMSMSPEERFVWFTSRYARKGRKWFRIENGGQISVPQVGPPEPLQLF